MGITRPGYDNYGAGGGYDSTPGSNYGNPTTAQPGVLIIRYLTP
jgi:hypothetical protein